MLHIFNRVIFMMNSDRPLGGYLRALSNAMTQDLQQQTEKFGLTSPQGMFLHHIWVRSSEGLGTCAKDLEEFFCIKHPTVSGILQRMEAAGFLTLHAKEDDRRCKAIYLTQKAVETHDAIEQHLKRSEAQLLNGMSDDEQNQFRTLLQMAANNLGVCCAPPAIDETEKEV